MRIDFNQSISIKLSYDNLGCEIYFFLTQLHAINSCERYRINLMLQRSTFLKKFVKESSALTLININMLTEEIIQNAKVFIQTIIYIINKGPI